MKICVDKPFKNCEHIYPIQQKKVECFLRAILPNDNIEQIIIFGSSVTERCHCGSDLDVYVKLAKNEMKLVKQYLPFEFDLWTNYMVDARLKNEIEGTGVVVYERDTI